MSSFPALEIEAALRPGTGEPVVQVQGTVLFSGRDRPLVVPYGDPRRQHEALLFFCSGFRRRLAGIAALRLAAWSRRPMPAAQLLLPSAWRERFGVDPAAAALYCGSPGPLQKVTLHLPALRAGQAATLVKYALHGSADAMIEREAGCLAWLAGAAPALQRQVPQLLDHGRLASGRGYLATAAAPGGPGPARLGPDLLRFLAQLAQASASRQPWDQGPAMERTRDRLQRLPPDAFPPGVHDLLQAKLAAVAAQLRRQPVPHTLAHGDFTRFNVRQRGGRFVVFDWEYAQHGANPVADLLHFWLSAPSLADANSALRSALAQAARFAATSFDGWSPTRVDLAALALHFLVDTLLFYATADSRLEMRSFIVRRYLRLVQTGPSWAGQE